MVKKNTLSKEVFTDEQFPSVRLATRTVLHKIDSPPSPGPIILMHDRMFIVGFNKSADIDIQRRSLQTFQNVLKKVMYCLQDFHFKQR